MRVALAAQPDKGKNYANALRGVGLECVTTLDPEEEEACDGLLLPGGGDVDPSLYEQKNSGSRDIDRELDERQLAMLERFLRAGKPIFGICRGMQLLNVRFGGTLIQHLSVSDTHAWSEGDRVHLCRTAPGSVLEELYGREFSVNSLHHQAVGAIGRGFRLTSWAPDGTGEAMEHESLPILAVQFHPERMCFEKARPDTVDGAELFRRFRTMLERYK